MTKEEFITRCQKSGYATKKEAEKYAKAKEIFTDADFEEVFRRSKAYTQGPLYANANAKHYADWLEDKQQREQYLLNARWR